jgi:2-polyprenyl-3-methyl-5-hydroxy-6-metoxy-1,4-benzoquinol methylase
MAKFYARDYREPGLTTDLPDRGALQQLINTAFVGSSKDFTKNVDILRALSLPPGARLLEYGASWGYATWQFRRAGFDVSAFEIAPSRAKFGEHLGVEIHTRLDRVGTEFDAVYSSHVLEHVPDPAGVLRQQLALVKEGGLIVCHTPNGSRSYRDRSKAAFHHLWGQVHPVLLTDDFVASLARLRPLLITSDDEPAEIRSWNATSQDLRDTSGTGLFFVIRQNE